MTMPVCPDREAGHCWHMEFGTFSADGAVKGEQCCWCGVTRVQTFSYKKDPEHGSYSRAATRELVTITYK